MILFKFCCHTLLLFWCVCVWGGGGGACHDKGVAACDTDFQVLITFGGKVRD